MLRIVTLLMFLVSCGNDHTTQQITLDETCNNTKSDESSAGESREGQTTSSPFHEKLNIVICENTAEAE